MRKRQKIVTNAIIPIVLLLGMVVMALFHTERTWKETMENMTVSLHKKACNQASSLKDKIDGKTALLDGLSVVLTKEELKDVDTMLFILQAFMEKTDFITVDFAYPDGSAYRNDGKELNIADRWYFNQCLKGEKAIERVGSGKLVDEARFGVAVPVIIDSKVEAVLVADFDDTYFRTVFEEASEGSSDFSYVCNSDGELITGTENAEQLLQQQAPNIKDGGSIFQILEKAEFSEGSCEQVETDMKNGVEGQISYSWNGEERYANYVPVGIHDWYVVTVLKYSEIRATVMDTVHGGYMMLGVAIVVAALLILMILSRERKEQVLAKEEALYLKDILEHDDLTGLITPKVFCERAGEILQDARENQYCIVFFDIFKFKAINEMFGRKRGDTLLCDIAEYITSYAGEWNGMSCRISGDSFGMLLPNDMEKIAEFAKAANGGRWGLSIDVYLHFGVYAVLDVTVPVDTMLDFARTAQKTIKGNYDNYVAQYDETTRKQQKKEQEIISAMARALAQREFVVYLQPQYNYENGKICGAEALVRWISPKRGLISPAEFIPVFETNGFITKLDEYMWEEVCKLLAQWKAQGKEVIPVSVNVSRADLYKGPIAEKMKMLTEKYEIEPRLLRVEITETAYMDNPKQLIADINELRDNGFVVEMDDFGSGYSSLNMLKDLPIHVLKTDLKFLDSSGIADRKNQILDSVVNMAHQIGLKVVAEGVETKEQADYLLALKCETMQGFYFSKPIPVEEFEEKFLKVDSYNIN